MLDGNKYSLTEYSKKVLIVRRVYLPLLVYFGKKEHSYWVTMPPVDNRELGDRFYKWFHTDFVVIVNHIVKKRNIRLEQDQKPSIAGNKFGWYLPIGVILEIQKMWSEENTPLMWEILRPADIIYGKGWLRRDIETVIGEYLKNNPL